MRQRDRRKGYWDVHADIGFLFGHEAVPSAGIHFGDQYGVWLGMGFEMKRFENCKDGFESNFYGFGFGLGLDFSLGATEVDYL